MEENGGEMGGNGGEWGKLGNCGKLPTIHARLGSSLNLAGPTRVGVVTYFGKCDPGGGGHAFWRV